MTNNKIIGECALCKNTRELEESHIIPKFVFRHLKKTSVRNIRSAQTPNMVIQDSEKHHMLCGECEDRFNIVETAFANRIFYPFQNNNQADFVYEDWLHYFITSVIWRCLYYRLSDFVRDGAIEIESLEIFIESEKIMRDYLMKSRSDIGNIENHMFFYGDIKEAGKAYAGKRPHVTFMRGESSKIFYYPDLNEYAGYTNLMGIILVSLFRKNKDAIWNNTQINLGSGTIKAANQTITSMIAQEFLYDIGELDNVDLSENQKRKIVDGITKDPQKFIESKFYQEYIKDQKLK